MSPEDPISRAIRSRSGWELAATLNPRARAMFKELVAKGGDPFYAALFAREDEAFTRPKPDREEP